MGNLLMIEKLLQVLQEFEQSGGMARQTPLCSSSSQELIGQKSRSRNVDIQTDILPRTSWLVGKTRLDVLTHQVNRWKIILLHRTTPYSALWQPWLVTTVIVLCVGLI